jgi:ABC-type glycerol-3-phosphate transport system substrate-binding protein
MLARNQSLLDRRQLLRSGAAAAALTVAAPFVRTAGAAGRLAIGLWDHWVPGANEAQSAIIKEWSDKEKVEVEVDYITSQGNKLLLTLAAEAQAGSGHDFMEFTNWEAVQNEASLERVDDLMKEVLARNGAIDPSVEYLAKWQGRWITVPMTRGSLLMSVCSRYDRLEQHAGIDVRAMYPAGKPATAAADAWTWDALLTAAEKCQKAGFAFGIPLGVTTDSVLWTGGMFKAFGADLMDPSGKITVRTDAVRKAVDYGKRLAAFLPADVPAWDDSSNNKWLISGRGSLIFNPPSAWAVAKRDAPQVAEKCWTHGFPKGPAGRFNPMLPRLYGLWSFSKNKEAARSLLLHLTGRNAAQRQVASSQGYDLPPYTAFTDFKTWEEEGPPPGALTHYPIKGGDQKSTIACSPAPPLIAAQIWSQAIMPKMIVRHATGEPLEKTLEWASNEIEGFARG